MKKDGEPTGQKYKSSVNTAYPQKSVRWKDATTLSTGVTGDIAGSPRSTTSSDAAPAGARSKRPRKIKNDKHPVLDVADDSVAANLIALRPTKVPTSAPSGAARPIALGRGGAPAPGRRPPAHAPRGLWPRSPRASMSPHDSPTNPASRRWCGKWGLKTPSCSSLTPAAPSALLQASRRQAPLASGERIHEGKV